MQTPGLDAAEDAPPEPGEDLTDLPGFWAAHLMWLCGTEDEEPEPEWFGVDGADVDEAFEALSDPERRFVLRVPFGGGHVVEMRVHSLPGEFGTEYVVTHPAWDREGHLATLDGHYAGPGLAWRELVHTAGTPDLAAPGLHDPHTRLLLLLPALGDADLPPEAAEVVREALVGAGIPEPEAPRLSEALLTDHPFWDPPSWGPSATTSPLSGAAPTDDSFDGILVCDEPHSPRNGLRLAQGITPEQTRSLAEALGTYPSVRCSRS
ncbi:hypothetical protein [Streptomyces tritici]|uniref:hypothetical protein n=1 Tax=Streptomyces tritici TaxID=2054410 RepID=UPI003AEFE87E